MLAAVAAGGFLGGLARYAVTAAWPTAENSFPWATFAVNTTGALCLSLLLTLLLETRPPTPYVRPALGTGFLGAFTTFSAVAGATDLLAASGRLLTAASYVAASAVAGLSAALAGLLLGRLAIRHPRRLGRKR